MKKHILLCSLLFLFNIFSKEAFSAPPTYTLDARNFNYVSNKIEFDIFIYHTNNPEIFEYSGGQYYFDFNPLIANGGTLTYSIIGSDLPTPLRPRGPEVSGSQLRLAANTLPGAGLGYDMTNNGPQGTKIVRMRLSTSAATLANVPFELKWRNPPVPPATNPVTKVYAYVGTVNTNITTPLTHLINGMLSVPQLISPANNSTNNDLSLTCRWNKITNATSYRIQVATDSLFNTIIKNDSVFADTSRQISGLLNLTNYFWRVRAMNTSGPTAYSSVWKFKTRDIIKLKLTVLMEGMYNNLFNQLQRRDTIRVFLANNFPPYAIRDSAKAPIDSVTFAGLFKFNNVAAGNYYIIAKHFNCIETWSKASGEFLNTIDTSFYNFTTAASQAFGNNMKVKAGKYTMYSGDVDQNGVIDGIDLSRLDNDAYIFRTGVRLPTDLNGDGIVDAIDFLIGDNNRTFITVITP